MEGSNFSGKLLAEKAVCILLVEGRNRFGFNIYSYLAIPMNKLEEFMETHKRGGYNLEEFGKVLRFGLGKPSPEIMKEMEEEFNFSHEHIVRLEM